MNRAKRKTNVKGNTGKTTSTIRNGSTTMKKLANPPKSIGTTNEKKTDVHSNKDVDKKRSNQSKSPTPTKGLPSSIEQSTPIIYDVPKKLERSNTFFITRKLSKIYNSLTGSKTSLNKIPENESDSIGISSQAITTTPSTISNPFKFVRSASLATIPLRKSQQRRSMVDDNNYSLQKLNEELGDDKRSLATSTASVNHKQSSIDTVDGEPYEGVTLRHKSNDSELYSSQKELDRKSSTSSFLSSLKRTFSVTAAKRKSHNARWSNSLLNLQQIDFMVSYEDLSFINYDKFNRYEETLKRQVIQQSNNNDQNIMAIHKMQRQRSTPTTSTTTAPLKANAIATNDATDVYFENYPQVKRRVKKVNNTMHCNTNFDGPKNVYRQSIDDEKLRMLNNLNQSLAAAAINARQSTYRNENENECFKRHSDTYNWMRSATLSLQQQQQQQPQSQQQKSHEQKSMGRERRTAPMLPIHTIMQEKNHQKSMNRRAKSIDDIRRRVTEIDVCFQNEFKVSLVLKYSLILFIIYSNILTHLVGPD